MMIPRVEVITSVERRRRWSQEDKERIVAASLEPGANVSAVARQAGVHTSQLFRWRRQFCTRPEPEPVFAAVAITSEPVSPAVPHTSGLIEVEFAGARLRITGPADPVTAAAVIGALLGSRR
jgi:transposase